MGVLRSLCALALAGCGALRPLAPLATCDPATADCGTSTDTPATTSADPVDVDADSDGYPASEDCDDGNPNVHPGASELCNGLDDDCVDGVDSDLDGDAVGLCYDCDETNPAIFPGAPEQCDDSVDSDCDGADCPTWTADFEGSIPPKFSFSGDADWVDDPTLFASGAASATSGNVADSQSSRLTLQVDFTSPGSIAFQHAVDSESCCDFLQFWVDGNELDEWSGSASWQPATYPIPAGSHTFDWVYAKDASVTTGQDRGWIDLVVIEGGIP